jgi:hypothetical protein
MCWRLHSPASKSVDSNPSEGSGGPAKSPVWRLVPADDDGKCDRKHPMVSWSWTACQPGRFTSSCMLNLLILPSNMKYAAPVSMHGRIQKRFRCAPRRFLPQ